MFFGGVAHLVERYIRIVEVVSSSLIVSTKTKIRSRKRADFRFVLFIIHHSLFIKQWKVV